MLRSQHPRVALIEPRSRHIIVSPHNCSEASIKRALGAWAVHLGPIQRRNSNAMSTANELASAVSRGQSTAPATGRGVACTRLFLRRSAHFRVSDRRSVARLRRFRLLQSVVCQGSDLGSGMAILLDQLRNRLCSLSPQSMVTCRPDTEVRFSASRRATGTGDAADFPRYRAARVRSVAQLARAPVSKTGGCGFESLHSCQRKINSLSPACERT